MGYTRVPKVSVRGEFSLRGEVLDIFLPLDEHATRIIFDFDTIQAIKEFETDTQVTINSKDEVLISPLKEGSHSCRRRNAYIKSLRAFFILHKKRGSFRTSFLKNMF